MILETTRVMLRPFRETDLNDLYEYSSQPGVGEMAGWRPHATIQDSQLVLVEHIKNRDVFAVVYRENKKVIGHFAVHKDSENGRDDIKELGYALHQDYQRQGIMKEIIPVMLDELRKNGVRHVYACCFREKLPSRRLIEACGFRLEQEGTYYSKSLNQTFSSYEFVYHLN